MTFDQYRDLWAAKTIKQIEREIASMRSYMQRHTKAYAWHGNSMTPTGEMADGDRLRALLDALAIRKGGAM